ncbi:MAG: hypothetical protein U9O94_09695, partial [Nanoarchaeota archaeon]|nr:hypothetical protein [Nanoarchaeota archaeon]
VREELENVAFFFKLKPLYSGMEQLTETKSYGHHVHWSAGSVLETMLLYLEMRNELWRIAAFSANSPNLNAPSPIMNDRLGNTYVHKLVPSICPISQESIDRIHEFGFGEKEEPLLISQEHGTLEVRASDLDPRSSATVAYIVLMLRRIQNKLKHNPNVTIYDDSLIEENMNAAKRYAVSNQGYVTALIDGEMARVPIQEELKRHYEENIEPVLRRMQGTYKRFGVDYVSKFIEDEMCTRIYDGNTPAQRQIDVFNRALKKSNHKDALIAAQKINFLNGWH